MSSDAEFGRHLAQVMRRAGQEALLQLGEELKARTIADLPVEDPTVDPDPEWQLRDHVEVRVYGDFVSVSVEGAYAVKQHEQLAFRHPRGGVPKFLERNAVQMAARMPGVFEGVVRRAFAGGKGFETHVGG